MGKKTPPDKVEEIKALSVAFDPKTISKKTGIPLRTVYHILRTKQSPAIETERAKRASKMRESIWDKAKETVGQEIAKLNDKCNMLLEHLTPEKAAKARATELTTAYGTLFDKKRLLQGESTENLAHKLVFTVVYEDGSEKQVSSADYPARSVEAEEAEGQDLEKGEEPHTDTDGEGNEPEGRIS